MVFRSGKRSPILLAVLCLILAASPSNLLKAMQQETNGEGPANALRELALHRGEQSREAFRRARGVLQGWWGHRDPKTGLLPRRLDQAVWAPQDNAADMFPFFVLTAKLAEPARLEEVLALFRLEIELTTRLGPLPDWYSLPEQRFLHLQPDIHRIIFGAAEYCKDGLIPMTEFLGSGIWLARMRDLVDAIFEKAPLASDFGPLPADSGEVNGDLLQVLARLHSITRESRYLDWAVRIGDAYLKEVLPRSGGLPPARWDFQNHQILDDRLSLNDHGNEIIGGLTEFFLAVKAHRPETADGYEPVLRKMFDILLEKARNADGLWYSLIRPSDGEVLRKQTPDTWGYSLSAAYSFGLATGEERYREAAARALENINQEKYHNWGGADSFADSIEGGLLLFARLPETEKTFLPWLETTLRKFYDHQKSDGVVEGWYGDGNFARTALMAALFYTRGASVADWREDLCLGGAEEGKDLLLILKAEKPWSGSLQIDRPRHRDFLRLPVNYPRLNEFPQWYAVESTKLYRITAGSAEPRLLLGAELIRGIPVSVDPEVSLEVRISPAGDPPYGKPRETAKVRLGELQAEDPEIAAIANIAVNQEYAGELYRWAGQGPVELSFPEVPAGQGSYALWLRWGSKKDLRRGDLEIGEYRIPISSGGYDGFHWIRVDIPPVEGPVTARVVADPGGAPAPFISQARLRRTSGSLEPDPGGETHQIEIEDLEGSWRLQTNLPGYLARGFRTSNAEGISPDALKGSLALRGGGKYALWARGYIGQGAGRSFQVAIGGKALSPTHRGAFPEGFTWELCGIVDLPAGGDKGEISVEIRDAGGGFEVADALLITSDLRFDPDLARRRLAPPVDVTVENARLVEEVIEEAVARAAASHRLNAKAMEESREAWIEARNVLSRKLRVSLGLEPFPERTPLKEKVLGEVDRGEYRIQRLIYESRPGFPVTANVYIPADRKHANTRGQLPAVLCPVGHWGLAKAQPQIQARCAFLARRGFLILTYDPFGQGERAVSGNGHSECFRAAPAGLVNLSFMVWDTIRGLDYLLARGDVDPERIGCTGASGGGLNTLYAAAVDERIRVAVPVVYLTSFEEFLKTKIDHCPCSHLPGLLQFADMGDILALLAPRPALLFAARDDPSFTIAGARAARAQALPAYRTLKAERNLALQEFDGPHDYNQPMREAMVGWMELHLLGRGDGKPIPEPPFTPEPRDSPALACFPDRKVPSTAATVASISLHQARQRIASLPASPAESAREHLKEILGWKEVPGLIRRESFPAPESLPEPIILHLEAMKVPAMRYRKPDSRATVLYVTSEGAGKAPASPFFQKLREGPWEIVAVDLPGWGSTAGREHLLHTNSFLLGEPMVTRRARALAAAERSFALAQAAVEAALAEAEGKPEKEKPLPGSPRILIVAEGAAAGLTALIAEALHPDGSPLLIRGLPESLAGLLEAGPLPEIGAFGLLRAAGIPQLVQLAGDRVKIAGSDEDISGLLEWLRGHTRI